MRERSGTKTVQVTLEQPSETGGDVVLSYAIIDTVWAEMIGLRGSMPLLAEVEYRFVIWYRSDVTARWRLGLVGTSRKFQILSAVPADGRKVELTIMAREKI